jgi:hypothetical protein
VPTFPDPPSLDALRRIAPAVKTLRKGAVLARVYYSGGDYPVRWNAFRHHGPTTARFDHHLGDGRTSTQDRSILYCASAAKTCFAEVFQDTRKINRTRRAPWLAVFALTRDVRLLDLTGTYPTRAGASIAINAGPRARARAWARVFYAAYPTLHGIYYASSMDANEPAIALNDRAEHADCLPPHPTFNRALADDVLLDVLKHSAYRLGYGVL